MKFSRMAVSVLGLCLLSALAQACDRSPLLIRNVNVWTPDGIQPQREVYISDGRVQSVRPSGRRASAAGRDSRVIDGRQGELFE